MTHRETIKEWLGKIYLKNCFFIDWGSGSKPVGRYIKYEECKYITIDHNPLIAMDRRLGNHYTHDIQKGINLGEADVAFCIEVLEHTLLPFSVLNNIYNNLKTGGQLYLTVPYNFRVHSDDDYYRFTENGLRALLNKVGFTITLIRNTVNDEGFIVEAIK